MKEPKSWRTVLRGPTRITMTLPNGTVIDKPIEQYTDADFELIEEEEKALAILTMALSPDIAQGFRQYTDARALYRALIEVYDGNEDMKQSRQDLLRQRFNMFNHVLGESLETQLQRFITLTTEMSTAGIEIPKVEVNKKLLNSLPRSWDMNVSMIKKTRDLHRLTLAEIMAIIKACELDDKQREINHLSSYSAANIGVSSNAAFSALPAQSPHSAVAPAPSSLKSPSAGTSSEDHVSNMAVNCYNAFMAGDLSPPIMINELDT